MDHLARIIDRVKDKTRVGVCIDTCHAYSAGYDILSETGYRATWDEFDNVVGRDYLKAIHLNDTKKPLGSRVDRHESIGDGLLGKSFFERFINDDRFNHLPIILETPDESRWVSEIDWLKKVVR